MVLGSKQVGKAGEFDHQFARIRRCDQGDTLAGDGVGLVSAGHRDQLQSFAEPGIKESSHLLDGIDPSLVDVIPAVPPLTASDKEADDGFLRRDRFGPPAAGNLRIDTAGASDEQLALILRIQVDQGLAGEEALFQGLGTVHAGLFGDGEKALQLAGRLRTFQHGQASRDADAVIRAECGIFRDHPSVFDDIGDRIFEEVVGGSDSLFADHILVGLQDKGRDLFLAGSGLPRDQHIAGLVCLAGEPVSRGPVLKISGHRLFVAGFTGNPGNVLENVENVIGIHNAYHLKKDVGARPCRFS